MPPDVILEVVRSVGIDESAFLQHYQDGSAASALEEELAFTRRLGIRSLPTYLLQYEDKALLLQSFEYRDFESAISRLYPIR